MSKEIIEISYTAVLIEKDAVYFVYPNGDKQLAHRRGNKSPDDWAVMVGGFATACTRLLEKGGLEVN